MTPASLRRNYIEELKQQYNMQQQALREGLEDKNLFLKASTSLSDLTDESLASR